MVGFAQFKSLNCRSRRTVGGESRKSGCLLAKELRHHELLYLKQISDQLLEYLQKKLPYSGLRFVSHEHFKV